MQRHVTLSNLNKGIFMKTVTVSHMRELDRRAIEEYGIPGVVLMENAGLRAADLILAQCCAKGTLPSVLIVCGRGNNGGDGFVIARHLLNNGVAVKTIVCANRDAVRGDALVNLRILEHMHADLVCAAGEAVTDIVRAAINDADLIVDALLGTGIDRPVAEPFFSVIAAFNNSGKEIVAIDAPSGLNCDTGEVCGIAVKAGATITMAVAKKGFFMQDAEAYVGTLHVVDISIPQVVIDESESTV